jgi:hypothetical protein
VKVAIGVDVDDVGYAVVREADVHASVVAAFQRLERLQRGVDQALLCRGVEKAGERRAFDAFD